jgi:hypothetical protein
MSFADKEDSLRNKIEELETQMKKEKVFYEDALE